MDNRKGRPTEPVRVGDVYEAGTLARPLGQMGRLEVAVRYQVASVSADGRRAVLRPLGEFSWISLAGEGGITGSAMDGWLLFDIERGNIERSVGRMCVGLEMSTGGESLTGTATVDVGYRTK